MVKSCIPYLVHFLRSQSHVVHSYAAAAIEKILIMKKQAAPNVAESALVSSADLAPIAEPLLTGLFGAFELQVSKSS